MKNFYLKLFLLIMPLVVLGCKNNKDPEELPEPDQTCSSLITRIDMIDKHTAGTVTDTYKYLYFYNAANKIIQIESYKNNELFAKDVISYSNVDEIDSVKVYSVTSGVSSLLYESKYTYSNGKVQMILQKGENDGVYEKTLTYSYNGSGQLTGILENYIVGSPKFGDGNVSNIVYTGGNITSYTFHGVTWSLVYDNYPNPYKGMDTQADLPWLWLSANNAISISADGTLVDSYVYTYENGKVKTARVGELGSDHSIETVTYECR